MRTGNIHTISNPEVRRPTKQKEYEKWEDQLIISYRICRQELEEHASKNTVSHTRFDPSSVDKGFDISTVGRHISIAQLASCTCGWENE